MDPVLKALLLSWEWRIELIVILLLAGTFYTRGWRHLRGVRQGEKSRLATGGRLAAYLSGLVVLGIALMSPIDVLGGQFFFMHMIQHLLLVMIVPPLLLFANPLPFFMWGLPLSARRQMGRMLRRKSGFRRRLRSFTAPGIVWMLFVVALLGWHDPGAYQAALRDEFVHDLEHLSFFATAMLFWWHVIGAGPRIHSRMRQGALVAYVLSVVPPNMAAGVAIAFSSQPIYPYYVGVPRLWGMTVVEDQTLGGIIMWIPGSMMYILAALILIARWVQSEDEKPPLPESQWATEESMAAPGLEKQA